MKIEVDTITVVKLDDEYLFTLQNEKTESLGFYPTIPGGIDEILETKKYLTPRDIDALKKLREQVTESGDSSKDAVEEKDSPKDEK